MGDCHARRLPNVHEAQKLEPEKDEFNVSFFKIA